MRPRALPGLATLLLLGITPVAHAAWDNVSDWSRVGEQADALTGAAISTGGDVDGDGYSDVLEGAAGFDGAFPTSGRVRLFRGGPNGPATTAAWVYNGDQNAGAAGAAVSFAGDVNGDGYDDVLVAEINYNAAAGRVFVFHGSAAGLSPTPARTLTGTQAGAQFGTAVTGLGDVNGDGYADIAISEPEYGNGQVSEGRIHVYFGGAGGIGASPAWSREANTANRHLGTRLAPAGDVNGDGYADLLATQEGDAVTVPGVVLFQGGVSGMTNSAVWTVITSDTYYLDPVCAGAGDVNGDGYGDVIVGDPRYKNGVNEVGRARVYLGSSTGVATSPAWSLEGGQVGGGFARSVGTAGDVNGDGLADILVGAPDETFGQAHEGTVHVFLGTADGTAIESGSITLLEGNQANSYFGDPGTTAGDVNGDGFSDVLVGAISYDAAFIDGGALFVYFGGGRGLDDTALWTDQVDIAAADYGSALAFGDWNGDGHSDLAVSAPGVAGLSGGHGVVYVYYGSDSGLPATPSVTIFENGSSSFFGAAVADAGDVNGDGISDLLVGANNFFAAGKAYVYYGGLFGLDNTADWSATGAVASDQFGVTLASAGDVNGDGYADILVGAPTTTLPLSTQGAAYLFLGSATGPGATPAWSKLGAIAGANLGQGLAGAGDVNADGYSDVIVGAPGEANGQAGEGIARIYLGSAAGLGTLSPWFKEGNQAGAAFGAAVACAGDVNGDGVSDVIIGAPGYDNGQTDEGRAFVYLGLAAGAFWTDESNEASAGFGHRVSGAGDVDGDGYSDWAVGHYQRDNGLADQGLVNVYAGSAASGGSLLSFKSGGQANARFGYGLAAGGDVNADGFADVAVGAPKFDGGQTDEGQAYLYLGNGGDGMDRERLQFAYSGIVPPTALLGRLPDGDRFRISVTARSAEGRGRVRLEYDVKPVGAAWGTPQRGATWLDTGAPTPANGSRLITSQQVGGLTNDTAYQWRIRMASDLPLFPHTTWLSPVGNAARESDLRTALDPSGVAERPAMDALLRARVTPNPFHAGVAISFALPVAGPVSITLFDVQGRRVAALGADWLDAGEQTLRWDGRDAAGAPVAGGVYFARLATPAGWTARKLLKVE